MTPTYRVSANGADLTAKLKTCLISLTINDEVGINSDTVEIQIDDRDGAVQLPAFGADLVVGIGYTETGIVAKGRYRVDEIECEGPNRRMLIRARAADTNAITTLSHIKAGVFRSWVGKTIADVATVLAKENGWGTVSITDEIIANAKTPTDQQTGQSDLDYLKLIVRDSGGQVKPANGQLLIFRQATAAAVSASGKPMPTVNVIPSDCMRWRCLMTRRSSHKKVAAGWTDSNGVTQYEVAESADSSEEDSISYLPETFSDQGTARNAATAKANALDIGSESVSLSMVGNPQIGAEVRARLVGFKPGVDRVWIVARVQHRIDEQGFTTEVEAVKQLAVKEL